MKIVCKCKCGASYSFIIPKKDEDRVDKIIELQKADHISPCCRFTTVKVY